MLAVTLACELRKQDEAWRTDVMAGSHTPPNKLRAVVASVSDPELKDLLHDLLERAGSEMQL